VRAIRGVLFDKDGTLVDFHATWFAIADRLALEAAGGSRVHADALLERAGYDFSLQRFRPDSIFAAGTNAEIVAAWFPKALEQERRRWTAYFDQVTAREGAERAVPVAGLNQALATLREGGLRLGLATNDSTAGARQTLLSLGVAQMFDAAFGYDAVPSPKPAPDIVRAFAEATELAAAHIAMVGDSAHDIEAGKAAGAGLVVGVLSGTGTRETLAGADVILDSVADLPALLGCERCGTTRDF